MSFLKKQSQNYCLCFCASCSVISYSIVAEVWTEAGGAWCPQELLVKFWRQKYLSGKFGDIPSNFLNMGKITKV